MALPVPGRVVTLAQASASAPYCALLRHAVQVVPIEQASVLEETLKPFSLRPMMPFVQRLASESGTLVGAVERVERGKRGRGRDDRGGRRRDLARKWALADAVHGGDLVVVGGAVRDGQVGVGRSRGGADGRRDLGARARRAVHLVASDGGAAVGGRRAPVQDDLRVAGARSQALGGGGRGRTTERSRAVVVEAPGRAP